MATHAMRIARLAKISLASLVVGACVTINVYFPAAAAEKAADQIIDTVTGAAGTNGARPATPAPATPPTGRNAYQEPGLLLAAVGKVLYAIVPAAQAQEGANLDISSPEIRAITSSMQARFPQLQKFFDSGARIAKSKGLRRLPPTTVGKS